MSNVGFTHYLVTRYCEDLRKQIKSLACFFIYLSNNTIHYSTQKKISYETNFITDIAYGKQ